MEFSIFSPQGEYGVKNAKKRGNNTKRSGPGVVIIIDNSLKGQAVLGVAMVWATGEQNRENKN